MTSARSNRNREIKTKQDFDAIVARIRRDEDVSAQDKDFTGADLRHADCTNLDLETMSVEGADFSGATFLNTDIRCANLTETRLDNVDLRTVHHDAHTTSHHKFRTKLHKASLIRAKVTEALIRGAIVTQAKLEEIEGMHNYDLQDLDLSHVSFKRSSLVGSKFCRSNVSWVSYEGADITGTDFSYTNISTANFKDVRVARDIQFYGAIILDNETLPARVKRMAKRQHAIFDLNDFINAVKNNRLQPTQEMPDDYFQQLCKTFLQRMLRELVASGENQSPVAVALKSLYEKIRDLKNAEMLDVINAFDGWKNETTQAGLNQELNLNVIRANNKVKNFIDDLYKALRFYAVKNDLIDIENHNAYCDRLLKVHLENLRSDIIKHRVAADIDEEAVDDTDDEKVKFFTALDNLAKDIEADLQLQINQSQTYDQILKSNAMQVLMKTADMLDDVCADEKTKEEKVEAIERYTRHFDASTFVKFIRGVTTVAIAAASFVLSVAAALLATVGFSLFLGPAALVPGIIAGLSVGTKLGIAASGATLGITAGTAAGALFFKPSPSQKLIDPVAREAQNYVEVENTLKQRGHSNH